MFLDKIIQNENNIKPKRKVENLVFLIIVLIITIIIINTIWTEKRSNIEKIKTNDTNKVLAVEDSVEANDNLETKMENILSNIKDVGKVKVFINYLETSSMIPIYDEKTVTSNVTEEDTAGGSRNTVESQSEKQVVFTEKSGIKEPLAQKTTMPVIQGVIITAEGATNATTKTDITLAVQAVTGLSIDKIQVFEMKK